VESGEYRTAQLIPEGSYLVARHHRCRE